MFLNIVSFILLVAVSYYGNKYRGFLIFIAGIIKKLKTKKAVFNAKRGVFMVPFFIENKNYILTIPVDDTKDNENKEKILCIGKLYQKTVKILRS